MAGNGETATNLSQQEDKVVPLELVNGSELDSAQEGSGGDVVNEVKQDGDGNQFAASGGGDGKGESENLKTDGGQDIVSKPADPQEKVTDGNTNGEYEQYSKLEENSKGVDIDKDVDEADKNTIKMEGDIGQSEMIVMDCFPAQQNSQIADEKEINKDILDNSVASSCNVEEEDGYATTDTDTSQIARDLVQHALDQAILTFHTDASSVPSLSSTQELNSEDSSHDMENNNINIEQSKNDKKTLETQDSVEEVETEVTFESIKQTNESIVSLNDSQEIGDDNEDDSMRELNDTEDAENKGKSSDQQQRLQENGETELLVSAEKMSDRGDEDSDASDAEFGGLAKLDPLPQYPDFPENYGNYKVCRSVEPGVKECIILETGECVRCKKSYSGICKTGKCTAVNNKEEIVSKPVNLIPIHDNDDGQLINDIPKNEVRSPNVSLSSASSNESGKAKTFRIDKSPKKDGKNAYSVTISEFNRNHDISSNLVQNDRTGLVNDENSVASFANDNERQFAYLDNLRSSRQEEFVLNNNFVPKTTVNSQKPPSDISYSQLSANNEDDIVTYPRSSQYRRETQNPEFSYQRIPNSEAQQMPQSFSSSSLYNRKYESSPLSDPSVLVRYQRNLISRDFPTELSGDTYQNVTQTSSLSDNDRINSQRKVEDRKLEFTKDQFELNQSERELLREIYSKYGQPREQMQNSFVSSASGDYSRNKSTQELLSSSNSSGHIPSYKTLHEQQASWMSMFHALEKEHQDELRHQYQRHQQAIFNLQQQVERDIHLQEQSFRKKLNAHKELLVENSSPSRLTSDNELQHSRLTDHSFQDFEQGEPERREHDSIHNSLFDGRSLPSRRETSPWREIYREIRQSIDDIDSSIDGSESSGPIRRPLDREFSSPSQHLSQLQTHSKTDSRSPQSPRSPRDRGSGRKPELTPEGFPRAGVYSSPMPILRNKSRKLTPSGTDVSISQDLNNSVRVTSPSLSEQHQSSVLQRDLENRHKERLEHQEERDTELLGNSTASDDVYLSSSTRMNLREKHAKHLSDLREYYEKELSELRSAISASENIMNQNPYKRVASENQNLHVENRLLKEKVAELEDDLDSARRTIRELEQKVHGLEVRASDYADHLNESQSKLSTFRSKMEEMQYQSREREQLLKELSAKIKYQEEALKNSKKLQEEQADIIVKDQSSVQKMMNKYSSLERDHNILKETLNSTENKLYDARKEVVELNRTVAKLELENKRLGRENDNLSHRHSQSTCINLSSIQGSFHEAFHSPEEAMNSSISPVRDSPVRDSPVRGSPDSRLLNGSFHKLDEVELPSTPGKPDRSQRTTENSLPKDEDLIASPLMKAEQDVYKLRNMMLSCASGQGNPPEPKLQKKYYGSDIKSNISSKNSDSFYSYGSPRGKREKSPSSISSRSTKSKSNKYSKSADQSVSSPSQSTPKKSQRPTARFNVEPEEFSSPTRFDVSSNGSPRSRSWSGQRQPGDGQTEKDKRSPKSKINSMRGSKDVSVNNSGSMEDLQPNQQKDKDVPLSVTETLNRVRSGVYVARPEWEDVYTSMAQPKKNNVETPSPVTRKDRLKTIDDIEHRYDELQIEKRKLESALSKTSSHGKGRMKKEQLENKLDNVEKELGSLRMSLKRWNILKTSS